MPQRASITDVYLEVRYVTLEAAGGSTRLWLSELADWLTSRRGTLIVTIREI